MITVQEAHEIIFSVLPNFSIEKVGYEQALGRVTAQAITADRDFPPFDRVMMDGIGINYKAFSEGARTFQIEDQQFAGSPQLQLQSELACLEVMTGAICPKGIDTIIPYEEIQIEEARATIKVEDISKGQNIHLRGSDREVREVIITPGTLIRAEEMAIIHTVGLSVIECAAQPTIAIVSTGDELVAINEEPLEHQIRSSNSATIQSGLQLMGFSSEVFHINDKPEKMKELLDRIIEKYDVLILSGGVSRGKKDYVPGILKEAGIKEHFHRVRQRPGKPMWFGSNAKTTVFSLPGNPVSTYMCFQKYVKPWLLASSGLKKPTEYARLKDSFSFKAYLTYFLQVSLSMNTEGYMEAVPVPGKGSGDFANLVNTHAFMELPADRQSFSSGEAFPIYR